MAGYVIADAGKMPHLSSESKALFAGLLYAGCALFVYLNQPLNHKVCIAFLVATYFLATGGWRPLVRVWRRLVDIYRDEWYR